MRRLFLMALAFCTMLLPARSGDAYAEYCSQMKNEFSVRFSVPEAKLEFYMADPFLTFTFGNPVEELPGGPIMEAGPVARLSDNCTVVLMNAALSGKDRADMHMKEKVDFYGPVATAWMLINCHKPWAGYYIYNDGHGGVILDKPVEGKKTRTAEEFEALRKEVASLRSQYERNIENSALNTKFNCDRVSIVRIPDIDKVGNMMAPEKDAGIKAGATECYGVELFQWSTGQRIPMLFFIHGQKVSIDACLAKMAKYMQFV